MTTIRTATTTFQYFRVSVQLKAFILYRILVHVSQNKNPENPKRTPLTRTVTFNCFNRISLELNLDSILNTFDSNEQRGSHAVPYRLYSAKGTFTRRFLAFKFAFDVQVLQNIFIHICRPRKIVFFFVLNVQGDPPKILSEYTTVSKFMLVSIDKMCSTYARPPVRRSIIQHGYTCRYLRFHHIVSIRLTYTNLSTTIWNRSQWTGTGGCLLLDWKSKQTFAFYFRSFINSFLLFNFVESFVSLLNLKTRNTFPRHIYRSFHYTFHCILLNFIFTLNSLFNVFFILLHLFDWISQRVSSVETVVYYLLYMYIVEVSGDTYNM